jgi:hypothetical protein
MICPMCGVEDPDLEEDEMCRSCLVNHSQDNYSLYDEIESLSREVEQLRVQLAGCSTAALGATRPEHIAVGGDYGWSPAYQDVLNLRLAYDELLEKYQKIQEARVPKRRRKMGLSALDRLLRGLGFDEDD